MMHPDDGVVGDDGDGKAFYDLDDKLLMYLMMMQ